MKNRREFLKGSLLAAGGIALAPAGAALAGSHGGDQGLPSNILYTAEDPGVWEKKVGSHAPQVEIEGDQVTLTTNHGMSTAHFIVRHTLISHDGQVLGATTFQPENDPQSSYQLPAGYRGKLYATSFCNKHDFWMTEVMV